MTFISKEEINLLPVFEYEGRINLINTPEEADEAMKFLSTQKLVGLDTETRPAFVKGQKFRPSLLQIATDQQAFLFRIKFFDPTPSMIAFFEDEKIKKVGVAIGEDSRVLTSVRSFTPKSFIDVSKEARARGIENEGLRGLVALLLKKRLLKGAKLTNWDRHELTETQLMYAAIDAVVSLRVYEKLMEIPLK
jgi:ribonuclease D